MRLERGVVVDLTTRTSRIQTSSPAGNLVRLPQPNNPSSSAALRARTAPETRLELAATCGWIGRSSMRHSCRGARRAVGPVWLQVMALRHCGASGPAVGIRGAGVPYGGLVG